jgi:hypothetical protein
MQTAAGHAAARAVLKQFLTLNVFVAASSRAEGRAHRAEELRPDLFRLHAATLAR